MNLSDLNETFGLPGVLRFEEQNGLTRLEITSPAAAATLYLQGAHLTHWQPAGQRPVLFLSGRTELKPGKAIRGGIPLCLPWFGARTDGLAGPSHGFARIEPWQLAFAALAGEDVHLTLTLAPTELSRSLGFDHFRFAYEISIGRTLTLRLTVANLGGGEASASLRFEEALHAYLAVGDVRQAAVHGLESATFLDKTDGLREKQAPADALRLTHTTDSVFPGANGSVVVEDPVLGRQLRTEKANSDTTVVWNPFAEGAAALADLGPDEWPGFLCVESANTGVNAIVLGPGEAHTLQARLSIEPANGDRPGGRVGDTHHGGAA